MHSDRILAIDPGSQILGWALIQTDPLLYGTSGTLKLKDKCFYQRVTLLSEFMQAVIKKFEPKILVIEKAFVGVNKDAALKLGQIRGAVMALGSLHSMLCYEYFPRYAKKIVTGYGAASKEQIFHVCRMTLPNMPESVKTFDESDAISLALCHYFLEYRHLQKTHLCTKNS